MASTINTRFWKLIVEKVVDHVHCTWILRRPNILNTTVVKFVVFESNPINITGYYKSGIFQKSVDFWSTLQVFIFMLFFRNRWILRSPIKAFIDWRIKTMAEKEKTESAVQFVEEWNPRDGGREDPV